MAIQQCEQTLERTVELITRLTNATADTETQRNGVVNCVLFYLLTRHWIKRSINHGAETGRYAAAHLLSCCVIAGIHDHRVAQFIHDHHWTGSAAIDTESDHLKFWKSAPHAVSVNQWHIPLGCDTQGHH